LVKLMVVVHSVSGTALWRYCLVSWASRDAHSPVSSSCRWAARSSVSICRAWICTCFSSWYACCWSGRIPIPSYGVMVRTKTVGMVSARVFFSISVVMMGIVRVTTLQPRGSEDPELPPSPEALPPSLEESLRTVCKYGDPLCTIL
jgi:hypothetical protein